MRESGLGGSVVQCSEQLGQWLNLNILGKYRNQLTVTAITKNPHILLAYPKYMLFSCHSPVEDCRRAVLHSVQGVSLFPSKDIHNSHHMIAFCFQIKVWEGICICRALVLPKFHLASLSSGILLETKGKGYRSCIYS